VLRVSFEFQVSVQLLRPDDQLAQRPRQQLLMEAVSNPSDRISATDLVASQAAKESTQTTAADGVRRRVDAGVVEDSRQQQVQETKTKGVRI